MSDYYMGKQYLFIVQGNGQGYFKSLITHKESRLLTKEETKQTAQFLNYLVLLPETSDTNERFNAEAEEYMFGSRWAA